MGRSEIVVTNELDRVGKQILRDATGVALLSREIVVPFPAWLVYCEVKDVISR
jgi:hypothetical protein